MGILLGVKDQVWVGFQPQETQAGKIQFVGAIDRSGRRVAGDVRPSLFEPLDEVAIADATAWLGFEAVTFATTDAGDSIYLRPGSSEANSVYLTHHDGGDTEVLAATVDEMLQALREAKPR